MNAADDPRNYLATEARVIAENSKYAVIAVRVEKALLARNLMFFSALADLAAIEIGPIVKNTGCL